MGPVRGIVERLRWTVLVHRQSGKVVLVDNSQRRLIKLQKRVRAWVDIVNAYRAEHRCRLVMVGLTYRRSIDYRPGHIHEYINRLRGRLRDKLLAWCWVAEVQSRGAIHYHVLILVSSGVVPKPDQSGMWSHGSSNIGVARSPWYLVKYIGKAHQKDLDKFPKGARSYGMSIKFGAQEVFRAMSGIWEETNRLPSDYKYAGSSVSLRYAEDVLAKRASIYVDAD